jgi:X8 domain
MVNPRPAYSTLSSHLAKVHPSSIVMSQYTPTNTLPQCSNTVSVEAFDKQSNSTSMVTVATNLPLRSSRQLCSCMMETKGCVASDTSVNKPELSDLYTTLCHEFEQACVGVRRNVSLGQYGSYHDCNITERLSWIYSRYLYLKNDSVTCESIGGDLKQPIEPASQESDCKSFLQQAGSDGMGPVTFTPTSNLALDTASGNYQGKDLSKGGKIGIGIGVTVFVIFSLAVILSLYLRLGRKSKTSSDVDRVELEVNSTSRNPPAELDGAGLTELATLEVPEVIELEGTGMTELGSLEEAIELKDKISTVVLDVSPSRD